MTAVAIAKRPLTVQYDGEGPQRIGPGEIVPRFSEWADGPRSASVGAGQVALVTDPDVVAEVVATDPGFRDDLFSALRKHGFKVTRPAKSSASE